MNSRYQFPGALKVPLSDVWHCWLLLKLKLLSIELEAKCDWGHILRFEASKLCHKAPVSHRRSHRGSAPTIDGNFIIFQLNPSALQNALLPSSISILIGSTKYLFIQVYTGFYWLSKNFHQIYTAPDLATRGLTKTLWVISFWCPNINENSWKIVHDKFLTIYSNPKKFSREIYGRLW